LCRQQIHSLVAAFFPLAISFLITSGRILGFGRGGEMNEVMNSGALTFASLIVSLVMLLVGLALWFFVNRASSRTHEQIELLEALLDQQKRQNALLRRLCEANEPEKEAPVEPAETKQKDDEFIRLVAER
jgi:membrane protein implicated in regulation of membrane protease activity